MVPPRNRLAGETSPYLQQHAANPVDWYPWGEEALARARREDKPILLSIGYSACHWCHVMAHESFEDEATARVMNEHFINIKVDREERPDIDQIYQTAHQMLTQRAGGWPLTMFLTPDQAPFFGGTYFPKEPRYGMQTFVAVMERVLLAYREKRADIIEQNKMVVAAFGTGDQAETPAQTSELSDAPIEGALLALVERFDPEHGGFGGAPKFPHPPDLELLLRQASKTSRHAVLHTLERMAAGGIYDHLGGGFCRYSTDAEWMIPHFEKMLYDNGPLLALYTDAWRLTKSPRFATVVEETAAWIMREMQSPEGGYYSSLDADSEGEEGKFYRWQKEEVVALLTPDELKIVEQYYGLAGHANFEGHYWHLHEIQLLEDAAKRSGQDLAAARAALARARAKLFAARERRVRPGRDEKILTSWNALAIIGMTRAAIAFGRTDWLASSRRALEFIAAKLWRDGRLLATYKDGRAHLNAYLDDYAYLLAALVEMLQAAPRRADLLFARQLADTLLAQFEDRASGGFFFTSHDHERLIHRPKQGYDNATASGNGVAALVLQRLGHLLAEPHYLAAAERALAAYYPSMAAHPPGYATFHLVLDEFVRPVRHVVLRGDPEALQAWQRELGADYRPNAIVMPLAEDWRELAPTLGQPLPASGVNAYVCQGVQCLAPVDSLAALRQLLAT